MLACLLTALIVQTPITVPAFATWDGKTWAGLAIGTSEGDLGKQVPKSKTVGPDPASVRIASDKRGYIVTAILTDVNNKGSVCGFTIDLEHDEPIESLEMLQQELGQPDYQAFPAIRYSDWSLAVWKDKGIVAAIQNGSRPLVKKVLLAPSAVLNRNLDLWERDPNDIRDIPRLSVTGFDINVASDPANARVDDMVSDRIRHRTRELMDGVGGKGWVPTNGAGTQIHLRVSLTRRNTTTVMGTVSVLNRDPIGDLSLTEMNTTTVDNGSDLRDAAESMLNGLTDKLGNDIDQKYRRFAWQAEWRQFTGLAHPRS